MENKEYSVLMSVYHKEKPEFLKESIESILKQTVPTDDFLIVCDGPLTKELDDVLAFYEQEYPNSIHTYRLKENVGLGRALNKGLSQCKHEIVARMDSDDISLPDRCEKQLAALEDGTDLVSGTVLEFSGSVEHISSKRELPLTHEEIMQFAGKRNPFNHPCMMYRKEAVQKAGGYKHFYLFEDYYLWARMLNSGARGKNLKDVLLYMRAGEGMYKRRGGFTYVKSMVKFRWYLHKSGLSSLPEFLITAGGQSVICMIPNGLREKFYQKFLRK